MKRLSDVGFTWEYEEDLEQITFTIFYKKGVEEDLDYNEILDLVKSKVDSGSGYNAEVYGIENQPTGNTSLHNFFIKVKP